VHVNEAKMRESVRLIADLVYGWRQRSQKQSPMTYFPAIKAIAADGMLSPLALR
jgi:hypothetical protein